MDYWNVKKRRLDWCQQYVLVERSARQALDWIKDTGEGGGTNWDGNRRGRFLVDWRLAPDRCDTLVQVDQRQSDANVVQVVRLWCLMS